MQIGNRIIYDQDGQVIYQIGEMQGDVLPRKNITELKYVDLEYGQIDMSKYKIIGIDVNTKQPILEEITIEKTPEQLKIEELENQILLMADSLEGGIL